MKALAIRRIACVDEPECRNLQSMLPKSVDRSRSLEIGENLVLRRLVHSCGLIAFLYLIVVPREAVSTPVTNGVEGELSFGLPAMTGSVLVIDML
jgi:hypothetical protein